MKRRRKKWEKNLKCNELNINCWQCSMPFLAYVLWMPWKWYKTLCMNGALRDFPLKPVVGNSRPLHMISASLFGSLYLPNAESKWSYEKWTFHLSLSLYCSLSHYTAHNVEYVHSTPLMWAQRVISRIGILHCAPVVYWVRCGCYVQFICECRLDNHATQWLCSLFFPFIVSFSVFIVLVCDWACFENKHTHQKK